jgi:hypothetical protein
MKNFTHHDFHLIYYTIDTFIYKHLGISVFFIYRIDIFFIFIYL